MTTKKKILIGVAALIAFGAIANMVDPEETPKAGEVKEAVFNSDWDGSVKQVKDYVKDNLNDPDSYESVEWSPVSKNPHTGQYIVRHKYRAKNAFNATITVEQYFYLDSLGNIVEVSTQ